MAEVYIERAESTWAPDVLEAIRGHYTGSKGPPPGKKMVWRVSADDVAFAYLGLGEPQARSA